MLDLIFEKDLQRLTSVKKLFKFKKLSASFLGSNEGLLRSPTTIVTTVAGTLVATDVEWKGITTVRA